VGPSGEWKQNPGQKGHIRKGGALWKFNTTDEKKTFPSYPSSILRGERKLKTKPASIRSQKIQEKKKRKKGE